MKVHLVKGRFVNSYIIEEGDKLLVIDVAMAGGERFVLNYIEQEMQRDVSDVHTVLCTHDDPDHIGGVRQLADACGAKLAIPFASGSMLVKNLNNPLGMLVGPLTILIESFRPRMWAMYMNPDRDTQALKSLSEDQIQESDNISGAKNMRKGAVKDLKVDYLLKNKMDIPEFEDWQMLHTPGHSWDSMCLFHKPTRVIISGDTLLCSKKKNQVVLPAIYTNPFQMQRSIKKLRKLKSTAIYPAHGTALFGEGLLDHL